MIAPEGLLGGLGSLTVFRDARVQVTEVGSKPGTDGFTLTAAGRLATAARPAAERSPPGVGRRREVLPTTISSTRLIGNIAND